MFGGTHVHRSASWKHKHFLNKTWPFSLPLARSSTRNPFPENEMGHKITCSMAFTSFSGLGKIHPKVSDPFSYVYIFLCSIFMYAKPHISYRRGWEMDSSKGVCSLLIGQEQAIAWAVSAWPYQLAVTREEGVILSFGSKGENEGYLLNKA